MINQIFDDRQTEQKNKQVVLAIQGYKYRYWIPLLTGTPYVLWFMWQCTYITCVQELLKLQKCKFEVFPPKTFYRKLSGKNIVSAFRHPVPAEKCKFSSGNENSDVCTLHPFKKSCKRAGCLQQWVPESMKTLRFLISVHNASQF